MYGSVRVNGRGRFPFLFSGSFASRCLGLLQGSPPPARRLAGLARRNGRIECDQPGRLSVCEPHSLLRVSQETKVWLETEPEPVHAGCVLAASGLLWVPTRRLPAFWRGERRH